jgi:CHAT domain-containing protein/tetratricopeptide (TPR) repeat protein
MISCRFFTVLSYLIFFGHTYCQNSLIRDSLLNVWNTESNSDSIRLTAMQELIWENYLFSKPDSAFYLATLKYEYAISRDLKYYAANAANMQGISWAVRGDDDKAKMYYLKCLELNQQIENKRGIMYASGNIGNIYRNKGEFAIAVNYFDKTIEIANELQDSSTLAATYNNVGLMYLALGDLALAEQYLKESMHMHNQKSDLRSYSNVLGNLATVFLYYGDYSTSLNYLEKSLEINKTIINKKTTAVVYANISGIYSYLRNYESAIKYSVESINLSRAINDNKTLANSLITLASLYQVVGKEDTMFSLQFEALSIQKKIKNTDGIALAYQVIGSNYANIGQYDSALSYLNQSLKINEDRKDPISIASCLNALGKMYFQKLDYIEAEKCFDKANHYADSTNSRITRRTALENLYKLALVRKDTVSAEVYLKNLIHQSRRDIQLNFPILTEKEKLLFFSSMSSDFSAFNSLALVRNESNPELAGVVYNNTILLKGILMKSSVALRKSIQESNNDSLIFVYDQWTKIKKELYSNKISPEKFDSLNGVVDQLEKELVLQSEYFKELDDLFNANWQKIQDKLGPNDVAIEFVSFNVDSICRPDHKNQKVYCALVLRKEYEFPELIELFYEEDLKRLLNIPGDHENQIKTLYSDNQLYDLIFEKIEPYIKKGNSIYYSPDGLLHRISFPSLKNSKGKFISSFCKLSLLSNTLVVCNAADPVIENDFQTALFGGIDFKDTISDVEVWEYLAGTETEVNQIQMILDNKNLKANVFKNKNATENALRNEAIHADIIHFATHGFYFPDPEKLELEFKADTVESNNLNFRSGMNNISKNVLLESRNPLMRSGLALSFANTFWSNSNKDSKDDGILTALELSMISFINTKLVVLSACETGLGDINDTEGVYGLQRALKMAGVDYVIMSLWKVPDKETAEFMIHFYKILAEKKNIKEAFTTTQIHFQKIYSPYYWGAFQLLE